MITADYFLFLSYIHHTTFIYLCTVTSADISVLQLLQFNTITYYFQVLVFYPILQSMPEPVLNIGIQELHRLRAHALKLLDRVDEGV